MQLSSSADLNSSKTCKPYLTDLMRSDYNFCPKMQTELSDFKVDHFLEDQDARFYKEWIHMLPDCLTMCKCRSWTSHIRNITKYHRGLCTLLEELKCSRCRMLCRIHIRRLAVTEKWIYHLYTRKLFPQRLFLVLCVQNPLICCVIRRNFKERRNFKDILHERKSTFDLR